MMKTICQDRAGQGAKDRHTARGITSVASDLDKILGPKNLDELERLETQIQAKLSSNEVMDTDYWEQLMKSLLTYKARAKLRKISKSVIDARLDALRKEQLDAAQMMRIKLRDARAVDDTGETQTLDPEPLLRLDEKDESLQRLDQHKFLAEVKKARQKVLEQRYVKGHKRSGKTNDTGRNESLTKRLRVGGEESAHGNNLLFDREVARGLGDNEEIFTAEEEVETPNKSKWAATYRPRKPKYFNRFQTGYEWNKYNQTHYDHDNPPPKIIQGYKFNIFYPDLVDKTRAPTYRIERENGRKRGQTFAPAGEDDTCLIRFVAGPPYEDIAFRIVDREWDFSAKRERGFRSSFDKVQHPRFGCDARADNIDRATCSFTSNLKRYG